MTPVCTIARHASCAVACGLVLWAGHYDVTIARSRAREPKSLSMVAERGRWARATTGGSSGSGSASAAGPLPPPAAPPTGGEPEPGPEGQGVLNWVRIVRHLRRLRRLQRLWHHLGEYLRVSVSPVLRAQLSAAFRPLERRR